MTIFQTLIWKFFISAECTNACLYCRMLQITSTVVQKNITLHYQPSGPPAEMWLQSDVSTSGSGRTYCYCPRATPNIRQLQFLLMVQRIGINATLRHKYLVRDNILPHRYEKHQASYHIITNGDYCHTLVQYQGSFGFFTLNLNQC